MTNTNITHVLCTCLFERDFKIFSGIISVPYHFLPCSFLSWSFGGKKETCGENQVLDLATTATTTTTTFGGKKEACGENQVLDLAHVCNASAPEDDHHLKEYVINIELEL